MIARMLTVILGSAIAFSSPVHAWNATGHMVIAKMAYNDLVPQAKTEVDRLTDVFSELYPNANTFETSAVWADDIRARDIDAFSTWHYITLPIYASSDLPTINTDPNNITFAITEAERVLKSKKTNDVERAVALSFYLHFMGDVHQPLHCASMVTKQLPNGDKGGNGFLVNSKQFQNLHQLWDSAGGMFPSISRPLSASSETKLSNLMNDILAMSKTSGPVADFTAMTVAKEGNTLAKNNVYTDIVQNGVPSEFYLTRAKQTSSDQAVLASKRIAEKLNCIMANVGCSKAA